MVTGQQGRETTAKGKAEPRGRARIPRAAIVYAAMILALFSVPLIAWASTAWSSNVSSYVLLIPFISYYLAGLNRDRVPGEYRGAPVIGGVLLAVGLGLLFATWSGVLGPGLDRSEIVAAQTAGFVACVIAGAYLFLGKQWMRVQMFPMAFLAAMIPLPDRWVSLLEIGSQYASAEAAAMFFGISGVPYLREGTVFQVPGIVLQVAQECSGIRSSLVLFITSILGAYLFLRSTWRRLFLIAVVIPLGILRNGFRILVIALLCVNIGPHMVDSVIHHWGGPLFFALSLIPLFLILFLLRKGDRAAKPGAERPTAEGPPAGLSDCPVLPK